MAISLMAIAKAYPLNPRRPDGHSTPRHRFRKERAEGGQCAGRRLWGPRSHHHPAGRGIQHPEGEFLDRARRTLAQAAIDYLVNLNRAARPCVPIMGDDRSIAPINASVVPVGLVS